MNRIGIYALSNREETLANYIIYGIKKLLKDLDRLIVVASGKISDNEKKRITEEGAELIVVANEATSFEKYKIGIQAVGWKCIKQYDELVLTDSSWYGPVYPFKELFDKMKNQKTDFWEIVKYPKVDIKQSNDFMVPNDRLNFIVIRNTMLTSSQFEQYWEDSIYHGEEENFCSYFEILNFKCIQYANAKKYNNKIYDSSIFMAYQLVVEEKCPIINKKVFTSQYKKVLNVSNGHNAKQLMDFIKKETNYDNKLILEDLIQTQFASLLRNNLHFNYILPTTCTIQKVIDTPKIALILYIYYEDLVDYCFQYAKSMPDYSDVFIVTTNSTVENKAKEIFSHLKVANVNFLKKENKGRDVSALLISVKDIVKQYEYICFAHDKKTPTLELEIMGQNYCKHCFDGILKSSEYVNNIINLFNEHPCLGFLTPPPPIFSDFFQITGREWGTDYEIAQDVLKKYFNLKINIDDQPTAAFGNLFWFRSNAFKTVLSYDWKYEDFPDEPLKKPDGTILHALERLYPILAQHDGFASGWIMPDDFAAVYIGNLYYMLRNINVRLFERYGYLRFYNILQEMDYEWKDNKKWRIIKLKKAKRKYIKYKLLSKITWGKTAKKYQQKKINMKNRIKSLKSI